MSFVLLDVPGGDPPWQDVSEGGHQVDVVYKIVPADGYAVLKPSAKDSADYLARMNDGIQFWQAGRGVPLRSAWNPEWELVIDEWFYHPKGIGDLAKMNRLITARENGYRVL